MELLGPQRDTRVQPPNPDMVAKAIAPDYGLGAHVAPLGLTFSDARMPASYASGAFIGQHGPGTASRWPATTWCSCSFANGRPADRRSNSSPAS